MAKDKQYIFNQALEQREKSRLQLIERYHDPKTRQRILATGIKSGWKCLEIGPGAGSIMRWLARTVGTTGKVVGLDINPRFVKRTRNPSIEIVQGDIATAKMPANHFHLAHARFVLIHTSAYRKALANILHALRPGGWLVLEEPDFLAARVVAGTKQASQSVKKVNQAIIRMFENAGLNPAFGLELPELLQQLELSHLTVENDTPISQGGTHLPTIMKLSSHQLRDEYLETRLVTQTDIERYCQFANDPKSWAIYHGTVITTARKQGG